MKKIILFLILCGFSTIYSQDLVEVIQKLTLEKDSLQKHASVNDKRQKQEIKSLQDSISKLNATLKKTTTELNAVNKKITELDKNNIKKERDDLRKSYEDLKKENGSLKKDNESLKKDNEGLKNDNDGLKKENGSLKKDNESLKKNNEDLRKDNEGLKKENEGLKKDNESLKKENGSLKKDNESLKKNNEDLRKDNDGLKKNNDGLKKDNDGLRKKETQIAETYNKSFDELIKSSTKQSVQRDMRLIDDNKEVKSILSDLEKYFNAEELLSKKFNLTQINDAQNNLKQIKQKSLLLDTLKRNVEEYKDFNDELKKTIEKLVGLDKQKFAGDVQELQKRKFQEILSILGNYMYNYYDYVNYPYLTNIVLEIIKRKQRKADEDITDLLKRL